MLRHIVREEVQRLSEMGGPGGGHVVPGSADELRDMMVDAVPPAIADRVAHLDVADLWDDVRFELDDGVPWEDIVDAHVHDFLVKRGIAEHDVDDILNHLA